LDLLHVVRQDLANTMKLVHERSQDIDDSPATLPSIHSPGQQEPQNLMGVDTSGAPDCRPTQWDGQFAPNRKSMACDSSISAVRDKLHSLNQQIANLQAKMVPA
jgi:hypothetical protein